MTRSPYLTQFTVDYFWPPALRRRNERRDRTIRSVSRFMRWPAIVAALALVGSINTDPNSSGSLRTEVFGGVFFVTAMGISCWFLGVFVYYWVGRSIGQSARRTNTPIPDPETLTRMLSDYYGRPVAWEEVEAVAVEMQRVRDEALLEAAGGWLILHDAAGRAGTGRSLL